MKVKNSTLIDVKIVTRNKKFQKTIGPEFSNKCKTANTIILVEDEKILHDRKAAANTFNNYFTDVTHSLGLKKKNIGLENTLSKIVESLEGVENFLFLFKVISEEEVKNAIKDLPLNRSTISGDIPTEILKQHAQIYSKKLTDIFN